MNIRKHPRTDALARGNHVVPTEFAEQLESEMTSILECLKAYHEALFDGPQNLSWYESEELQNWAKKLIQYHTEYTDDL